MIAAVDREWAKKLNDLILEDPTLARIEISAVPDTEMPMGRISSTDRHVVTEHDNSINLSLADLGNLRAAGAVSVRSVGNNRFEVTLHKKALELIASGN